MRHALQLHPDSVCPAGLRVDVDVARPREGSLVLRYLVTGRMDQLQVPPVTAAARTDGLWQHTCFEAFVRAAAGTTYYEFNFAPSTAWAAYRFSSYRSGLHVVDALAAPRIDVQVHAGTCTLQASLELDGLQDLPPNAPWHLGLSAVIEETSGRKSYWALKHPPGKADFHHAKSFACEVPPVERP